MSNESLKIRDLENEIEDLRAAITALVDGLVDLNSRLGAASPYSLEFDLLMRTRNLHGLDFKSWLAARVVMENLKKEDWK